MALLVPGAVNTTQLLPATKYVLLSALFANWVGSGEGLTTILAISL